MSRRAKRRCLRYGWLAAPLVGVLMVSACTSSGSSGSNSSHGSGTLTVGVTSPLATLNPALLNANPSYLWMNELAYGALISYQPDGSFAPDMATSFGYVGSGNTKFQLKLRSGVKFADGAALTAQAVAASLNYSFKTGTSGPVRDPAFTSATATGPLSVLISCSAACPSLPLTLSQSGIVGSVISPAGLRDKNALGTKTFGAGPYVLNSGQTVVNDHYTFDANANYYKASSLHYKHVVVRIISDPSARIAALKAGTVSLIDYVPTQQAASVKSSGLTILPEPSGVVSMLFHDRVGHPSPGDPQGAIYSPPLGNKLVRQALSMAVDRKKLTDSLGHGYVTPSAQWTAPTAGGYDPTLEGQYAYNPTKAKTLLTQAGYPNGFTVKVLTQKTNGNDLWALGIAQYWEKIGVKVQLTDTPDLTAFFSDAVKYPVVLGQYGAGSLPYSIEVNDYYGTGGWTNQFSPDPTIAKMIARANAQPEAQAQKTYLAINRYAVENALNMGVGTLSYLFAYNQKTINVTTCPKPTNAGQFVNCAPLITQIAPA